MTDWKPETHATTTVARTESGTIRYIKCRAEYFEVRETPEGEEDEFEEGVSAKFKFDVVDGEIAHLTGVKEIDDGAPRGYTTSLDFVRAVPVAEDAVSNVPGIEHVESIEGQLLEELDRAASAREQ